MPTLEHLSSEPIAMTSQKGAAPAPAAVAHPGGGKSHTVDSATVESSPGGAAAPGGGGVAALSDAEASLEASLQTADFSTFKERYESAVAAVGLTGSMSRADELWGKAFLTMKGNRDSKKFEAVPTVPVRGQENYILSSPEFRELMADCETISDELKKVVDKEIAALGSDKWAFWTGGGGAQEAAQKSGMVCLESTAFGQLFDGLTIQGFPYDMELWGALSLAYTEKAAAEADDFEFHAFIAEDAKPTGVFTNIEMDTFGSLTRSSGGGVQPDIHFHAVAVKGHEWGDWKQIEEGVTAGGCQGTYARTVGKPDEAKERMTEMSQVALKGNRDRGITPPWE